LKPGGKSSIGGVSHARAPVRVEIGVLSLPAGTQARGGAIASAVRHELARVLGSEAAQTRLRALGGTADAATVIDAGRMSARPGERAERLGSRIAGLVAGSLLGGAESGRRR
jgi:hypothetical protein